MTQFLVASMMRPTPVTLTPNTPIRNAIASLVDNDASAAPVTWDGNYLEGILTQKDCFRPALYASYHQEWTGSVKDFMSGEVLTIDADFDVVRAAEIFLANPYRVLPVIERGHLAGLLHRSEVLKHLARNG